MTLSSLRRRHLTSCFQPENNPWILQLCLRNLESHKHWKETGTTEKGAADESPGVVGEAAEESGVATVGKQGSEEKPRRAGGGGGREGWGRGSEGREGADAEGEGRPTAAGP